MKVEGEHDGYGKESDGTALHEDFDGNRFVRDGYGSEDLVDWICVSEQMKENNNKIRDLTGEYKQIEPKCREGVREKLERMKKLCEERNSLYEKQNELKGQREKLERNFVR